MVILVEYFIFLGKIIVQILFLIHCLLADVNFTQYFCQLHDNVSLNFPFIIPKFSTKIWIRITLRILKNVISKVFSDFFAFQGFVSRMLQASWAYLEKPSKQLLKESLRVLQEEFLKEFLEKFLLQELLKEILGEPLKKYLEEFLDKLREELLKELQEKDKEKSQKVQSLNELMRFPEKDCTIMFCRKLICTDRQFKRRYCKRLSLFLRVL